MERTLDVLGVLGAGSTVAALSARAPGGAGRDATGREARTKCKDPGVKLRGIQREEVPGSGTLMVILSSCACNKKEEAWAY